MEQLLHNFKFLNLSLWDPALITLLRVVLIALAAWIGLGLMQRLTRLFGERITRGMDDGEQVKRAATLGRVFRYIAAVIVLVVATTLILSELGIAVAPILGAAGVIGLAVGFGAQSLVKDYFAGFFILLENQMRQGDIVDIAGKAGLVEEITLRYVRLRDYDGNVHFVSNGLITTVTNMSRGYAQSVVDVGVAYREDTDEAVAVMRETGAELRADPAFGPKILDELEIAGVDKWADSAVILRCRFKVRPLEQWNVRREFLRRLKKAFDARGIEIPFPHLTIYAGVAKDGSAAPFRLHGADRTAERT
jgi:small-conductance mechanosensitive channel